MYTTHIGRRFLDHYNQTQRQGQEPLTPKAFFEEVMWPVVFDCPDEVHLMHVTNSAFFQGKNKTSIQRKIDFFSGLNEIVNGDKPISGAYGVGYQSGTITETTSGQVTELVYTISTDDLLLSWIGGALSVGYPGGYNIIFDNIEILDFLFKGWGYYRDLINQTDGLKGKQIEGWNGHWLSFGWKHKDDIKKAFEAVKREIGARKLIDKNANKILQIERQNSWAGQLLGFAREYGFLDMVVSISAYGQQNKSLGFVKLAFPKLKRMYDYWDKLMDTEVELQEVFVAQYGIERACRYGQIGLEALKPKDLENTLKDIKSADKIIGGEKKYLINLYITWILAMLNNEQTLELANKLANTLIDYKLAKRQTVRDNRVVELLESPSQAKFIEILAQIAEDDEGAVPTLNETVEAVYLHIPYDLFRLFKALLRFSIAKQEYSRKNNK